MTHDKVIYKRVCMRCGHTWYPRSLGHPKTCPSCKSVYWNNPEDMIRLRRSKQELNEATKQA